MAERTFHAHAASERRWRYLFGVAFGFVTLLSGQTADAKSPLNGWQRLVVGIGKDLSRGVDAQRGFSVDYNASFAQVDYGVVLSPGPGGQGSSMNVITRCVFDARNVVSVQGQEIPAFEKEGEFRLGTNVTAEPDFITRGLGSVGLGLKVDRKKSVKFGFEDLSLEQLTEAAANDAVNAPPCLRDLRDHDIVYVVRGRLSMKLSLLQSKTRDVDLNAALSSNFTRDPAKVGFDVAYSGRETWRLRQKAPRPWFRIVGRMARGSDGSFRFVEEPR